MRELEISALHELLETFFPERIRIAGDFSNRQATTRTQHAYDRKEARLGIGDFSKHRYQKRHVEFARMKRQRGAVRLRIADVADATVLKTAARFLEHLSLDLATRRESGKAAAPTTVYGANSTLPK